MTCDTGYMATPKILRNATAENDLEQRVDPVVEDEGLAVGGVSQGAGEVTCFAGEHERRQAGELGMDALELALVGPRRLLGGGSRPPGVGGP